MVEQVGVAWRLYGVNELTGATATSRARRIGRDRMDRVDESELDFMVLCMCLFLQIDCPEKYLNGVNRFLGSSRWLSVGRQCLYSVSGSDL